MNIPEAFLNALFFSSWRACIWIFLHRQVFLNVTSFHPGGICTWSHFTYYISHRHKHLFHNDWQTFPKTKWQNTNVYATRPSRYAWYRGKYVTSKMNPYSQCGHILESSWHIYTGPRRVCAPESTTPTDKISFVITLWSLSLSWMILLFRWRFLKVQLQCRKYRRPNHLEGKNIISRIRILIFHLIHFTQCLALDI